MLVWLFFLIEAYMALAHTVVLTGFRLLPRQDLVRNRLFFLLDTISASTAYCLHQAPNFLPVLLLQQCQHVFYVCTWDRSAAAKRVISWSSLDWDRARWNQIDLVLGTAFDLSVHMANTYFLGRMMSMWGQTLAGTTAMILYYFVIYNPSLFMYLNLKKGAWSSPNNIPDWVSKRIQPLTEEQIQQVTWMDKLTIN